MLLLCGVWLAVSVSLLLHGTGTRFPETVILLWAGIVIDLVVFTLVWWRALPEKTTNYILLGLTTLWTVARIWMELLYNSGVRPPTAVLTTALAALAFVFLPARWAILHAALIWFTLMWVSLMQAAPDWELMGFTTFTVLVIGYMALYSGEMVQVRHRLQETEELVHLDALTCLHNRRYALTCLDQLMEGRPAPGDVAVMLLDLDHFKSVNDQFGHAQGDRALRMFAQIMVQHCRQGDVQSRWGGEEFVWVLKSVSVSEVEELFRRVQWALELVPVMGEVPLTVSAGLAWLHEGQSPDEALHLADSRLYAAKTRGRNQMVTC